MRKPIRATLWLTVLVIGAIGGSLVTNILEVDHDGADRNGSTAAEAPETVEVIRRDIAAVLVLDAVTTPLPEFVVPAPVNGHLQQVDGLAVDDQIEAGQQIAQIGSQEVKAPVAASFSGWLAPDGTNVTAGVPLAGLRYGGFGLVATLPPADAYRLLEGELSAAGSILYGPSGFECPILQRPSLSPDPSSESSPTIICAIPREIRAYPDIVGQVAVRSGFVADVLSLPTTAVSGGADQGEVSVVAADGTVTIQKVELGVTDGAIVEIVSGLEEGMMVLADPPQLAR